MNQILSLELGANDYILDGESIPLSTADFDLLWELACHAGQILGREALFRSLRGRDYDGQDRSMDVAISRLRRRLGDDSNNPTRIKTVRQKGYLLVPQAWE
jgi:two-component system response regulator RstA